MKKAVLFFALMLAISMATVAQAGSDGQQLVGTWTDLLDNSTVIFNANGTVSGLSLAGMPFERWIVADHRIALFLTDRVEAPLISSFYFSSDGRTLLISVVLGQGIALRRN